MNAPSPIKVSIITGFLGAGKTTILNKILKHPRFNNAMVIINEFGDIGLDHQLVENTENDMLLMSSGCICCSIRGDLVTTFEKILRDIDNKRLKQIDHIIIETTGVAAPGPIIGAFLSHPYLHKRLDLNCLITIADASNIIHTLCQHPEAKLQISMADHIILTKLDLINQQTLPKVQAAISATSAEIPQYKQDEIDIASLILDNGQSQHNQHMPVSNHDQNSNPNHHHSSGHHHGDAQQKQISQHGKITAINFERNGAYNQPQLMNFLDILRSEYGQDILRIKAIVSFEDMPLKPFAIHGVQHLLFPPKALNIEFSGISQLVIIGKSLNKGKIQGLYNAFIGDLGVDQADIAAIEDNPLSLLGMTIDVSDTKK